MSGSSKEKNDLTSIESLLEDIETEESLISEQFPSLAATFADGDSDDFEELESPTEASEEEVSAEPDFEDDLDDDDLDDDDLNNSDLDDNDLDDDLEDDIIEEKAIDKAGEKPDETENADKDWVFDKSSGGLKDLKNSKLVPFAVIALLVIIIIVLLMQDCAGTGKKYNDENWYDTSAIEGTLPGKTPEEIEAMLNQVVEEGMFNISIAPVIVFDHAFAQGQARIENIPANHYNMGVVITLDDTSETVYESKGIRPGQYIEYITLNKELSPGEYAATAMFTAYDVNDLSEQGRVAVKIKLIVE